MSLKTNLNCSHYLELFTTQNISALMVPFYCVRYSLQFEVFLIIIFIVLFIGTAGGNLLVIISVAIVKKLQTPSNFLILNLACSDFLVSILVLPGAVYQQINRNRWPFSELLCDIFISFDVLLCTSSILNLCAISIDRYLVITRPLQYAVKRTPARIGTMIGISWLSSALISIPPMIGWKETFVPGQCNYSENLIYQIYATFGAFYIPLLVMLVLYGRIFKLATEMAQADNKLSSSLPPEYLSHKSSKDIDSQLINGQIETSFELESLSSVFKENNNVSQSRRSRSKSPNDSKAITTLGVIMGCFTICWLPFFILQIAKSVLKVAAIDYMFYLPLWLIELCLWLGYVNSFLNPIIYVKFNREFRTPFKQILLLKCSSINARLRSETFEQEYGVLSSSGKGCNCGKRLSVDQSSLNNSKQLGNRRRRQQTILRSKPLPSNCNRRLLNNNVRPTYECSQPVNINKSITNGTKYLEKNEITIEEYNFETISYHYRYSDHMMPCCQLFDQRSERYTYDYGPSSEAGSVDSPPPINISINDLTNF